MGAWVWTLALIGLPLFAHWFQKHFPDEPEAGGGGCPRCMHDTAVDKANRLCGGVEDITGFASAPCSCQNDFHRRRASLTTA